MNPEKKKRLEDDGWTVGSIRDLLGLSFCQMAYIDIVIFLDKIREYMKNLFSKFFKVLVHWTVLMILVAVVLVPSTLIQNYKNSGYYDNYFQNRHDYNSELSYNEIMHFAERIDSLTDKIEREFPDWYPQASDGTAYALVAEMAAMFQYENASEFVNYPAIYFEAATMGGRHNHIAGYSDCNEYFVLNLRFVNPFSTWNDGPEWISTLAHELAHNHQGRDGCVESDRGLLETTALLISWEVMHP